MPLEGINTIQGWKVLIMWKAIEIPGIDGRYEVSDLGEVRNTKRKTIKSQTITKRGYYRVALYVGEKKKDFMVHQLVGNAFVPKPEGAECINHIDENKLNNRADNLEWCTLRYNARYGTAPERGGENRKKSVSAYKDGKKVSEYDSLIEASKATGAKQPNITSVLQGKLKTAAGYEWRWTYGNATAGQRKSKSDDC